MIWKYICLFSIAVLLSGCSVRQLEVTSMALTVADWSQTRQIRKHPELEEGNPVMRWAIGKNPPDHRTALMFTGQLIALASVPYLVEDAKTQKIIYAGSIVTRLITIISNRNIGLKVKF